MAVLRPMTENSFEQNMTVKDYNQAVDQYADGIYRFVLKSIKNQHSAEDIVQDSFEKLWRNIANVDGAKVKAYLFTTAYHTMIDRIRKEKRETIFEEAPLTDAYGENNYSDLQEVLNQGLNQLSEIQRMVLLLRDYEGYSYREICELTRLNESQVKVYIYRARVFLKNYIGKMEVIV